MSAPVLASALFKDSFGTPAMRAVWDDAATIARYVEVEVALARAQGRVGVIPPEAAAGIAAGADAKAIDFVRMKDETEIVGYPILPLVRQLVVQCGEAGRYVHWGATTQDIMDTAVVLQMREGLRLVEADLVSLQGILRALAMRYRDAPMAGRTHLQQALPVSFGYKVAIWLAMVDRHVERLAQLRPRALLGQFAGAAGTLASIGEQGLAVQREFCRELGLGEPVVTWHVARDGLCEAVQFLGLVTATLAKVATDVMLMMLNEVAEVFEPFVEHRGASSTMPQKRNPISCELIIACSKAVRHNAALALEAMVHDFERATGPWHAEWIAIPEAFMYSAGALHQAKFMLGGLEVDTARMRRNLGLTSGLIVAEAVMMGLAPHTGRQQAHDIVYASCRKAAESGRELAAVLREDPAVAGHLSGADIDRLCDPVNYLGAAPQMVDRAVAGRTESA